MIKPSHGETSDSRISVTPSTLRLFNELRLGAGNVKHDELVRFLLAEMVSNGENPEDAGRRARTKIQEFLAHE